MGYVRRVLEVKSLIRTEIASRLSAKGLDIDCFQWPWFSYYAITPNGHPVDLERVSQEPKVFPAAAFRPIPTTSPQTSLEHWDWQGHSTVLPGIEDWRDVWTWGALAETARERIYQLENSSPPLVECRRLRRLCNFVWAGLYGTLAVFGVCHNYTSEDTAENLAALSVHILIFLHISIACAYYYGSWFTASQNAVSEVIGEVIEEMKTQIGKRTGGTARLHPDTWLLRFFSDAEEDGDTYEKLEGCTHVI